EWGCLEPASMRQVWTSHTVAVLPVDLFGRVVEHRHVVGAGVRLVVEDACQAVGAKSSDGRWGGMIGTVGAWSFNGAKNVAAGEAGAMVTDDDGLARRARLYISHGENWESAEVGLNGRLNELTACVATHGLRAVLTHNRRRRHLAGVLRRRLGARTDLALPDERGHALYVYPLVLAEGVDRSAFVKSMRARGIEVGEGYIRPAQHRYPAFHKYQRIP
ncbi:MAG: DegT/DnrJ/EryC1/StrS family aminotransferase, partial [Dehalococcoidia bacterium]|nr:DegT/DnrJ/EryC1/StrS family aminotransferase [Dehalococcoidia bacterium]